MEGHKEDILCDPVGEDDPHGDIEVEIPKGHAPQEGMVFSAVFSKKERQKVAQQIAPIDRRTIQDDGMIDQGPERMPVQQRDPGACAAAARTIQSCEPEKKTGRRRDAGRGEESEQSREGSGQCQTGQKNLFLFVVIHYIHGIYYTTWKG